MAKVRGVLSKEAGHKVKVGHSGTLDPFATGLLVLLIGKYTKKSDEFLKLNKTYEATLTLGKTSTTGDPEGGFTPDNERQPNHGEVISTLNTFFGHITRTPPIFSAIKSMVAAYKSLEPAENTSRQASRNGDIMLLSCDYPE